MQAIDGPSAMILRHVPALIAFVCVNLFYTFTATAQDTQSPLTSGCINIPPYCVKNPDGSFEGFVVDLSKELSDRLGLTITFESRAPRDVVEGQRNGTYQIWAGAISLPPLSETNLISTPVAQDRTRVFARVDELSDLDASNITNLRITYVQAGPGTGFPELSKNNTMVPQLVPDQTINALIANEADVIISAETGLMTRLRDLEIDHLIVPVGAPLRVGQNHVYLHQSRGDLMPAINATLNDLKADGTLSRLKQRWNIDAPAPVPDVLKVGVYPFPPYKVLKNDGTFTGFSVEILRDLADRTGLAFDFVPITLDAFRSGPRAAGVDLFADAGVSDARKKIMDFSSPIESAPLTIFTRAGETDGVTDLDSLKSSKVGVSTPNLATRIARRHGGLDLVEYNSREALLRGLVAGEVDAALFQQRAFIAEATQQGLADQIQSITPPFYIHNRAIAFRPGLGTVRERINVALRDYLVSEDYAALDRQWLHPPEFWTPERKRMAIWISLALLTLFLVFYIGQRLASKRKARARQLKFLELITRNIPSAVYLVGADLTFKFVHRGQTVIAASTEPEFDAVGLKYDDISDMSIDHGTIRIAGKTPDSAKQAFRDFIRTDDAELEFQNEKNQHYRIKSTPLPDGSKLLICDDITLDKQGIIEQRTQLAAILNAAQNGIVGLGRDGKIAITNPSARYMLGSLSEQTPFEWPSSVTFLDPEDLRPLDASRNPMTRALSGIPLRGETAIMSAPGAKEPRYVRLSSAAINEDSSADVGTVVIIDDVSEQEKHRQQIERSARLDALGQLTGGIAHDFNNLLATIEYSTQLARGEKVEAKRHRFNDTALRAIRRGAALTNRLLAFAKLQQGMSKPTPVETVISEFRELVSPTIEAAIKLDFDIETEELWVLCDPAQLENALLNLVLNARDALVRSGKGHQITIKARGISRILSDAELKHEVAKTVIVNSQTGKEPSDSLTSGSGQYYRYVEFSVTDNGPGMDDETKRRATDPFFTTKEANSGTGLGLSMVYGFVQQSDGELRIYSEPGIGTTVRMLLPGGTRERAENDDDQHPKLPKGQGQTILIAEDEPDLSQMITDMISSLGYSVKTAPDSIAAMEALQNTDSIDLLITDIVMPGGMSGFELAKRARDLHPDLPVIYMSGYSGFTESDMGDVIGQVLSKPCPPAVLAEAIETALDSDVVKKS